MAFLTFVPTYVWPLFTLLLFAGLRSLKTSRAPIFLILLVPALFFIYSLISFLSTYGANSSSLIYWVLCISIGMWISCSYVGKLELRFDENKRWVEIPGSLMPLIFFILIFSFKCCLGVIKSQFPHLMASIIPLVLELFSAVILGFF